MFSSRQRLLVAAAVAAYAMTAVAGRATARGEIFPFFSWDLFSQVPSERVQATVMLHTVGGTELDEPTTLWDSGESRGSAISGAALVSELAAALQESPERVEELRYAIEANHLPSEAVWSVAYERFSPVERWNSGDVQRWEVARFGKWTDPLDGFALADGVLRTPRGDVPVGEAGSELGGVTQVRAEAGWRWFEGWAGDADTGEVPELMLVVADGAPVAVRGVGVARPDLAEDHPGLARAGFRFALPDDELGRDVRLYAVFEDHAALLSDADTGGRS